MEPVSTQPARKGKKGSLENPEVYENVPGDIIPILEREFDDFDVEAEKFLGGDLTEEQFIGFRLKQGVYGQRQADDAQMIRVKIPQGILSAAQLEALADVAEQYSRGFGHITTRQNVQFHFVKLHDAEPAMRHLAEAGLTTREACGNSVP